MVFEQRRGTLPKMPGGLANRSLCAGMGLAALALLAPGAYGSGSDSAPYDVPEECPGRTVWLASVRDRLPPLLRTHPLLDSLSVQVDEIAGGQGGAFVGSLANTADAGSESSRNLRGATCDDVLDALSFIAALSLERAAKAGASSLEATALESATAARNVTPVEPTAIGVDELTTTPAGASGGRLRLAASAFALLQDGLTPGQGLALGAGVRFSWSASGWQPSVALGVYSTLPDERRLEGGGRVRFEHWSSHAVVCPWRFPEGASWSLGPCVDLDVGLSLGEAFGVANAARRAAPWFSAGLQLRAEITLWNRLELGASLGAVAPLWRSHFYVSPQIQSFETPVLGARAGSHVSLIF